MIPSLNTKHLYSYTYRNQRARRVPFHKHPFWQLEIIRSGPVTFLDDSGRHTLHGGKALLIPGGCRHSFAYPTGEVCWSSFKFEVEGAENPGQTLFIPHSPLSAAIIKALSVFVDHRSPDGPATVFNALASALLEFLGEEMHPGPVKMNPFLRRIEKELQGSWGSTCSVRGLAARLGYEPGYLSVKFKQATGNPLKDHIDQRRAARAVEFLEYSSLTISEIAEVLAFPEVYAFSRFFKRCKGVSPLAWRRRQRPGKNS